MQYDYYYYKSFYTPEECTFISNTLKVNIEPQAIDNPAENVTKTSIVNIVPWRSVKTVLHKLEEAIQYTNQRHFGFDIYSINEEDYINHNIYDSKKQGEYNWHKDATIGDIYDIKLTAVVNISPSNYKGGEFELFLDKPVHLDVLDEPGTLVIFPSYTQHRVKPVIEGARESLSIWVHGPNFR